MFYERSNKIYDFRKIKTVQVFRNEIRDNIIDMRMVNDEQNQLSKHIKEFKSNTKPHNPESKKVKEDVVNSAMGLLKGREMVFKAFESGMFLKHEELKKKEKDLRYYLQNKWFKD